MAIRVTILWLLVSLSSFGQLVTLPSLDALLARTPIRNETAAVASGLASNDWGGVRLVRHYTNNSGFATNLGNVFQAKGATNGQWVFLDRTNGVQDIRWWFGNGQNLTDNSRSLTNAAAWLATLGGGDIRFPTGTYKFTADGIDMPSGVGMVGDGPGSVLNFTSTGSSNYPYAIRYAGSRSSGVRLASAAVSGGYTLVLASSVDWAAGDQIALYNTNDFSGGGRSYYRAGQFAYVHSVSGGTNVTLSTPLWAGYATNYVFAYKITPTVARVRNLHFALPTQSAGLTIHYGAFGTLLEGLSAAGTEYQHFGLHSCWGSQLVNCRVDYDSDSVGMNYGALIGSSESILVDRCYFATGIAGMDAGNSDTDLDFFCRRLRIQNSTFRSIRSLGPGLGLHGNVIDSTIDNCEVHGVNLVGGNSLINSTVYNGPNYSAVNCTEMYRGEATITGNRFIIRTFGLGETEPLARVTIAPVNAGASGSTDTNIWAGTWGGTTNQWVRFNDNQTTFLTTMPAGYFGVYIDESTLLSSNPNAGQRTFGGVEVKRNKFSLPDDQPWTVRDFDLIYVAARTNLIWSQIDVSDNWLPFGGIGIEANGGDITVERNVLTRNTQPVAGIRVIRSSGGQYASTRTRIVGNTINGAQRGGILHYRLYGRAEVSDNTVIDHGRAGTANAIDVSADAGYTTNLVELLFRRNYALVTSSPVPGFHIDAPSAHVVDELNREVGVSASGSRIAASIIRVPWTTNSWGATNVVALVGAVPTASLPTPVGPAVTYDPTLAAPVFYTGSAWETLRRYAETNFANLYATNTVNGKDLAVETASVGPSRSVFATLSDPLYVFHGTNGPLRVAIQNNSTGSDSAAGVGITDGGSAGSLLLYSPNNSSSALTNRMVLDAPRLGFDVDSGADIRFSVSGSSFATLTESLLDVPRIQTKAATNVPTHVLITGADPTSTARQVQAVTLANLKNSLAIASTDITDSTSAGRALLTASNAAAQLAALGTGSMALVSDAPSDGNQYVRSNATWAITSGGGGGSAGPTNILKLYDHLGAAPPYTNAHVSLISDAISIGWADSTYGTIYDSVLIERGTAYSAKHIKLFPLTIGMAGFRQKDPASSTNHIDLSSVGFNGAVPIPVVNFSDTTPAAPSAGVNVKWQITSTNASAYVPLSTVAAFKAQDGEPPASSYATFSTRNSIGVMLFDPAAQEAMRYRFVLPYGYSAANATVVLKWTTSATSGDARWGARFMALTGDIDSDSFAVAVEGTTTTSATAGTVMTTTLSAVGLDSAVAGDGIWLEVYRDVGDAADTINSNDLELHSVEVRVE